MNSYNITANYLHFLVNKGVIRLIDMHFALFLLQSDQHASCIELILAALVNHQASCRMSFLDISNIKLDENFPDFNDYFPDCALKTEIEDLKFSSMIGDGEEQTPLVIANNRLYLYRYYIIEKKLARFLFFKASQEPDYKLSNNTELLSTLFPDSLDVDYQKLAAIISCSKKLSIISGGPGTGKTTTVARILTLLSRLHLDNKKCFPQIKLVAPTGKAAARLGESLLSNIEKLPVDPNLKKSIPKTATTIHRLINEIMSVRQRSLFIDASYQVDIVVIDEVSMVDITLMHKLTEILPSHCHLVMLGDKNQLPSVDAGNILHDIAQLVTKNTGQEIYSENMLNLFSIFGIPTESFKQIDSSKQDKLSILNDCYCHLKKSYRFDPNSQIAQIANLIQSAHATHPNKIISQIWPHQPREESDVQYFDLDKANALGQFFELYQRRCISFVRGLANEASSVREAFNQFFNNQLLCATRRGPLGVETINHNIELALEQQGLKPFRSEYYLGRPLIILQNSHHLRLYNGDIGIVLRDPQNQQLQAAFLCEDTQVRYVPLYQLPKHETVFAMTIHKSQGSEFNHTFVLISSEDSDNRDAFVTRELIYTGITRCRKTLYLATKRSTLNQSILRSYPQSTGISYFLGSEDDKSI